MHFLSKAIKCYNHLIVILVLICTLYISTATGAVKHGFFAKKLDEYFSTIKCMANIMEDLMPEPNTVMMCCGVWLLHDMMSSLVLDNCYEHNYHQVKNITAPFIMHMEENCWDYPRDAFACKLMIITPITILILILIMIITLSVCALVTCVRLRRYQRHLHGESQCFDSDGTEETTDDSPTAPDMDIKKKPIDV